MAAWLMDCLSRSFPCVSVTPNTTSSHKALGRERTLEKVNKGHQRHDDTVKLPHNRPLLGRVEGSCSRLLDLEGPGVSISKRLLRNDVVWRSFSHDSDLRKKKSKVKKNQVGPVSVQIGRITRHSVALSGEEGNPNIAKLSTIDFIHPEARLAAILNTRSPSFGARMSLVSSPASSIWSHPRGFGWGSRTSSPPLTADPRMRGFMKLIPGSPRGERIHRHVLEGWGNLESRGFVVQAAVQHPKHFRGYGLQ